MKHIILFNVRIEPWLWAPLFYFLWVSVLLAVKKLSYAKIRRLADKTKTMLDDILLDALNLPLTLLVFASGAFVLEKLSPFGINGDLTKYFFTGMRITAILAIVIFFDKFLRKLISVYSKKVEILKTSGIFKIVSFFS